MDDNSDPVLRLLVGALAICQKQFDTEALGVFFHGCALNLHSASTRGSARCEIDVERPTMPSMVDRPPSNFSITFATSSHQRPWSTRSFIIWTGSSPTSFGSSGGNSGIGLTFVRIPRKR